MIIHGCSIESSGNASICMCSSQAGLRTLQDLAPEMRLAMAMEEEGEGFEGEIMEDEELFRVSGAPRSRQTRSTVAELQLLPLHAPLH